LLKNSTTFIVLIHQIINLFIITMEGTVKFFNESKGFGFITNDETGKDIFVHVTGLNGEALNEGDKVEYVEEEGRKGMVAAQVRVIHD
jgi:CspA family cold shock protein